MRSSTGVFLFVVLLIVLAFLVVRWFWTWCFKINARLNEMEWTNELLQSIYDASPAGTE